MSPASLSDDVAAALSSVQNVYDELTVLKGRLADVKTVEEADRAHQAALADLDQRLQILKAELSALTEAERRRRRSKVVSPSASTALPPAAPPVQGTDSARAELPAKASPPPPTSERHKFKKVIARWQFAWRIDQVIVAQVNSIADSPDRPLGEALALLDRSVLEMSIPGESDVDHAARLREWKAVLESYADQVRADIETHERRFHGLLGIWELWKGSRLDEAGLAAWRKFIEMSRAKRDGEITELSAEVEQRRKDAGR